MVCWLASQLDNESICSAGAVSPLAATSYLLAKATHAPDLTILMTSGGLLDVPVRPMLLSLGEALDTASAAAHCGGEGFSRSEFPPRPASCSLSAAAHNSSGARPAQHPDAGPTARRAI